MVELKIIMNTIVVVMNLPLCPQTADDIKISLVNELQISNIQKLVTAYFLRAS